MMFYNRCIIRQIIKSEVTTKISKSEVTTITTKYWFGWKKWNIKINVKRNFEAINLLEILKKKKKNGKLSIRKKQKTFKLYLKMNKTIT